MDDKPTITVILMAHYFISYCLIGYSVCIQVLFPQYNYDNTKSTVIHSIVYIIILYSSI